MKFSARGGVFLLVILTLLFGVQGVQAQQEVIVWFDPQAAQVNAGETTTVKLIVDAQNAVNSFDLTFEYDPNVVQLESWKYGGFLTKFSAIKNEATAGRLWLVAVQLGVPPVTGAGVLLEFTLRGVAPGTSALTFSQVKFADSSGVQYDAGVTEGSISVAVGALPTATLTLAPTATLTLVPTHAPTATRTLVPTQAPTATRTSTPVPQATSTPQKRSTTSRPANATGTSQPIATAQPGLQQAVSTNNPPAVIDAAATQTVEANSAAATLDAMSTTSATGSIATPVQAAMTTATAPAADKENSELNLTTVIIVFDLIMLVFIAFILWRRRHKNMEGKS